MESVCEAGQSLIAGHLQVKVHIIRGVGVEELPGTITGDFIITEMIFTRQPCRQQKNFHSAEFTSWTLLPGPLYGIENSKNPL